ncbi:hypothetical protein EXIGLDRAFT_784607, partial [Exidia glandulosa HHB12029]
LVDAVRDAKTISGPMLPSQWRKEYEEDDSLLSLGAIGPSDEYYLIWDEARLTLRTLGVIDTINLAPFEARRVTLDKVAYLQQFVLLGGLASATYNTEVWALQDLIDTLKEIAPLRIEEAKNPAQSVLTHFGNRMFTPRDDAHEQTTVEVTDIMDPNRKLRDLSAAAGLVHTPWNAVAYLKRTKKDYVEVSPASFRPGDIVEVHFRVALFKTGRQTLIPKFVLHTIASVDSSFTTRACRFTAIPLDTIAKPLKRKRVSFEEVATRACKTPRVHRDGKETDQNEKETDATDHGEGEDTDMRSDHSADSMGRVSSRLSDMIID